MREARRNPHLNPKISAYKALKPYSYDSSYYISFTEIDKIGINPGSRFDTPIGIYAYPLKEIWEEYELDKKKDFTNAVPYAGDRPWVWLLQIKPSSKIVKSVTSYEPNNYVEDLEKLKQHVLSNKDKFYLLFKDKPQEQTDEQILEEHFKNWARQARANANLVRMWNITRNLALKSKESTGDTRAIVQWNFLLRKVLGYDVFKDIGAGYIHPYEPIQAVFLSRTAFTVKGQFHNKSYSGKALNVNWLKKATKKNPEFSIEKAQGDLVIWRDGTWVDGVWEKGVWKNGIWEYGAWVSGIWEKGVWKNGSWNLGKWYDGVWLDGVWKDGTWENGIWAYGIWKDGVWWDGTWKDGIWRGGTWRRGDWKNGIWENGNWYNGVWEDGIWKGGYWKRGMWKGGTWEKGYILYKEKWEYSTVSPPQFFINKSLEESIPSKNVLREHFVRFPNKKINLLKENLSWKDLPF